VGGSESAETGRDPVDGLAGRDRVIDELPGRSHPFSEVVTRDRGGTVQCNGDHLGMGEGTSIDNNCVHIEDGNKSPVPPALSPTDAA
jgi:hypothetical protein